MPRLQVALAPFSASILDLFYEGDRARFRPSIAGTALEELPSDPPVRSFLLPDGV